MKKVVMGPVTLYQGSCERILPELEPVDAVITDPPYSSGGMVRGDRMARTRTKYQQSNVARVHADFSGDNRDQRGFLAWAALWLGMSLDVAKPGAMLCVFSDWRQLPVMSDAIQAGGWCWRGIVPWDKRNPRPMPNRFKAQCEYVLWGTNGPRFFGRDKAEYYTGLLSEAPPKGDDRIHSAQKPVGIMAELCRSVPVGGSLVDPFVGSGQTVLGALRSRRNVKIVGIEKDPLIFQDACRRVEAELRQIDIFQETT